MKPALSLPPLLLLLLAARSATQAPSPPHVHCAKKLAAMSSCLPRVLALPENATSTPSATCCQAFATATDDADGGASCLCDLIRTPSLLGSHLDTSRLVSFLSSCRKFGSVNGSSFVEDCQDSSAKAETKFPPLLGSTLTNASAIFSADDSEAESGSEEDPDRRGRRPGRPPKTPRPSPSPPRPSHPPPSHPPPPQPAPPLPQPAPPPPERRPCPRTPTVPEDIPDDGRRELPCHGALLLLLPIWRFASHPEPI